MNNNSEIDYLFAGLGNPDSEELCESLGYERGKNLSKTRHNIGFMCLDDIAKPEDADWEFDERFNANVCFMEISGKRIMFVKPQTTMNFSGDSISAIKTAYDLQNDQIMVIFDDLSIPYGEAKIKKVKSSGGHNGVGDITSKVGKGYFGIKVGVANPDLDHYKKQKRILDFVLSEFSPAEKSRLSEVVNMVRKRVETITEKNVEIAMNENSREA